jgi:hypothetical protein
MKTVLRTAKNGARRRAVVQSVRLSTTERLELRRAATSEGVSVSDYVRRLVAADAIRRLAADARRVDLERRMRRKGPK